MARTSDELSSAGESSCAFLPPLFLLFPPLFVFFPVAFFLVGSVDDDDDDDDDGVVDDGVDVEDADAASGDDDDDDDDDASTVDAANPRQPRARRFRGLEAHNAVPGRRLPLPPVLEVVLLRESSFKAARELIETDMGVRPI